MITAARETLRRIIRPPRDQIEAALRAHVCVGGTFWDQDRKATFAKCACGARCYLVDAPDNYAAHVTDVLEEL